MLVLRDYQQSAIDALRQGRADGHRCQILASPTGSGKTAMACHLIHGAVSKGKKALFIVNKIVLIDQSIRHLQMLGLNVGIMQGENTNVSMADEVVVASIQTIRSRKPPPDIGFVVIDECHELSAMHIKLLTEWTGVPFIGLSATPLREDLGNYFSNMVTSASISDLMGMGYLVPVKAYCPTQDKINQAISGVKLNNNGDYSEKSLGKAMKSKVLVGDVVSTWFEKAEGKRTLCFAVDIAHSRQIVEDFLAAGVEAAHIDKDTTAEQRMDLFEAFRNGDIKVLSSVNVLSIGFDMPVAEVGILARPTLSLALYIQQIGRLIRPAEGKSEAIILDHADNVSKHGLPANFFVYDLDSKDRQTGKAKRKESKLSTCKSCGFVLSKDDDDCPECGTERQRRSSKVVFRDGRLVEIGESAIDPVDHKRFYQELKGYQADHPSFKSGWAVMNFKNRFGYKPPHSWRFLPEIRPSQETIRWVRNQFKRWKLLQRKGYI